MPRRSTRWTRRNRCSATSAMFESAASFRTDLCVYVCVCVVICLVVCSNGSADAWSRFGPCGFCRGRAHASESPAHVRWSRRRCVASCGLTRASERPARTGSLCCHGVDILEPQASLAALYANDAARTRRPLKTNGESADGPHLCAFWDILHGEQTQLSTLRCEQAQLPDGE